MMHLIATILLTQSQDPETWWKLDEGSGTTAVESVAGSNGSLQGGTAWSSDVPPVRFPDPSCLSFDGQDDCVDSPASAGIVNTFTMTLWAKPLKDIVINGEDSSGIDGISGQSYAVFPRHYGAEAGVGISVGLNGISVYEHGDYYLAPLLTCEGTVEGWIHIAVVYTDRQPSLYVDGELVQTGLTSLMTVHPGTQLGGIPGTTGNYGPYQGLVDDFRIYDRALTASEIASLGSGSLGFDRSAPDVASLAATGQTSSTVAVTWPAPANDAGDGGSGPAALYDLRWSRTAIDTPTKFETASPVTLSFHPAAPGAPERAVVAGLAPSTTYHFAMKCGDAAGNWSAMSASVPATTLVDQPPATTTLTVLESGSESVTLGWTAPGEDGMAGTAAAYDLRVSDAGPIDTAAKFAAARRVAGMPAPASAGTRESVLVAGLHRYATYHFAIVTSDGFGTSSARSASLKARTNAGGSAGAGASCAGSAVAPVSALLCLAALLPFAARR